MVSKIDTAELRAALAKIAPPKWYHHARAVTPTYHIFVANETGKARGMFDVQEWPDGRDHADVACLAVNALPAALDRIDALEAALQPFADLATAAESAASYDPFILSTSPISGEDISTVRMADLFEARKALAGEAS